MMAREPSPQGPNYHLVRINQPDIKKSSGGGVCQPGFRGLGPGVEGDPPRRYRITTSLGIQWATAGIPAGCDFGATPDTTPGASPYSCFLARCESPTLFFHIAVDADQLGCLGKPIPFDIICCGIVRLVAGAVHAAEDIWHAVVVLIGVGCVFCISASSLLISGRQLPQEGRLPR